MTESVHIQGIGDGSLQHPAAAFVFYSQVTGQLAREKDAKVLPLFWLLIGFNLFWLKRFGKWI